MRQGQSVTLTLTDEIDASRGDVFAGVDALPGVADQFETTMIWMSDEPMLPGRPEGAPRRAQELHRDGSRVRAR